MFFSSKTMYYFNIYCQLLWFIYHSFTGVNLFQKNVIIFKYMGKVRQMKASSVKMNALLCHAAQRCLGQSGTLSSHIQLDSLPQVPLLVDLRGLSAQLDDSIHNIRKTTFLKMERYYLPHQYRQKNEERNLKASSCNGVR